MNEKIKISYTKLWELLLDKKMKKTELKKSSAYSSRLIENLIMKNIFLSGICFILGCDVGDIMEFIPFADEGL